MKSALIYSLSMLSITVFLNVIMLFSGIQWDCPRIVTIGGMLLIGYLASIIGFIMYWESRPHRIIR